MLLIPEATLAGPQFPICRITGGMEVVLDLWGLHQTDFWCLGSGALSCLCLHQLVKTSAHGFGDREELPIHRAGCMLLRSARLTCGSDPHLLLTLPLPVNWLPGLAFLYSFELLQGRNLVQKIKWSGEQLNEQKSESYRSPEDHHHITQMYTRTLKGNW